MATFDGLTYHGVPITWDATNTWNTTGTAYTYTIHDNYIIYTSGTNTYTNKPPTMAQPPIAEWERVPPEL